MNAAIVPALLLFPCMILAQTTITITDNNGNQTQGTISDGNVFFHDGNGNTTTGTIRDGNVYMHNSTGETTIGTIQDGNVFLRNSNGTTTGTIKDGLIFLRNSDGSHTTGTYSLDGSVYARTTGGTAESQADRERWKQIQQQNYEAGQAIGSAIGNGLNLYFDHRREKKFCKQNPSRCENGHIVRPDPYAEHMAYEHAYMKRTLEETRLSILAGPRPEAYATVYMNRVKPMCSIFRTETYTDLDGMVKTCSALLQESR